MSSDFGFTFVVASTTVANGANVPFTSANFVNTPPVTSLSIVNSGTSTAAINIANSGFYQVTFGVSVSSGNALFGITVNGAAVPVQQTFQTSAATGQLTAMSCIIQVTANPTTVGLQNVTGSSVILQNFSGTSNSVLAFISIIKLM
jgi:hypothetical protein